MITMGSEEYSAKISLSLEPGEHPEDAQAWNHLRAKVRAFVEELSKDPAFTEDQRSQLAPKWSLEFSHDEEPVTDLYQRYTSGTGPIAQVGDLVEVEPTGLPFDRPSWTVHERGYVQRVTLTSATVLLERNGQKKEITFDTGDLTLIRVTEEE